MRSFIKGILTGTFLGVLAGAIMKTDRKPELKDLMDITSESELKKKTGKIVKGMARTMDKLVK